MDIFLYVWVCVVVNGEVFYWVVFCDLVKMFWEYIFELLFYLVGLAFEKKIGVEWDYFFVMSYEIYFNWDGWGGKSWLDNF